MLYGILIAVHIVVCVFLIIIVLIQAGRGGGLSESFSGAESIFGTKTNNMLTRATSFFAVLFFATCLSLAILSKQRSNSIIRGAMEQKPKTPAAAAKQPVETKQTPQAKPQNRQMPPDAAPAKEKPADTQTQPQENQNQQETNPAN